MPQEGCPVCAEPVSQLRADIIAVVIILALFLVYYAAGGRLGASCRDRFASRRAHEVFGASQSFFKSRGGDATYSDYREVVPRADAVLWSDSRSLWKKGKLSPETVENII